MNQVSSMLHNEVRSLLKDANWVVRENTQEYVSYISSRNNDDRCIFLEKEHPNTVVLGDELGRTCELEQIRNYIKTIVKSIGR